MTTSKSQQNPAANNGNSITAAELQQLRLPQIKWIVPDLLPAGLTILAGSPKSGKSWLALDLALSVASGAEVLDQVTRAGSVIYYALEDSPSRVQARINDIWGNHAAPEQLH